MQMPNDLRFTDLSILKCVNLRRSNQYHIKIPCSLFHWYNYNCKYLKKVQKLSVFERKILRKIFGPTKEANGIWRIKTNKELDELIEHWNIINYVKAQQLS